MCVRLLFPNSNLSWYGSSGAAGAHPVPLRTALVGTSSGHVKGPSTLVSIWATNTCPCDVLLDASLSPLLKCARTRRALNPVVQFLDFQCPFLPVLPSARDFDTTRDLSDNGQPRRTRTCLLRASLHANEYSELLATTWKEPGVEQRLGCLQGQSSKLCSRIVSNCLI
ncbi:hypothetical protein EVAR_95131_1 [Eumeta japonica]|uniref:Uncharacterized protein n=1 Tax=Eumeta variegata TaxID=151549 RepID=A0A4C1W5S8_EUMVA|nr:hypothetical protein EVAR_95131_1 [Eumeta japonica]